MAPGSNGLTRIAPLCGSSEAVDIVQTYVSEFDEVTRDVRLHVRDPEGTRSQSHADQGEWSVEVVMARGIGRPSESRVAETLRETLVASRLTACITDAADHRGEDRTLRVGARTYVLLDHGRTQRTGLLA